MSTSTAAPSLPQPPASDPAPKANPSPREVERLVRDARAVIIDVREPDEHARERIAGSHLLPLSRFDPSLALAHAGPDRRIITLCRSGARAADAARRIAAIAPPNVDIAAMAGGLEAWKRDGLPVEINRKAAAISIMRQVQLVVGVGVLIGAALAWFVHPAFLAIPAFFGAGLTFAGATGTCALAALLSLAPWNAATKCAERP